ncbi:MAG: aspartyl protease family protein [Acidobacteria bacterium]|nr:aspartyl protease family protein [Acidobacteriota bacterium]
MKRFALSIICLAAALSTTAAGQTRDAARRRAMPPAARFASGRSPLRVPFDLSNDLVLIRGRVNASAPLWFIFDTGASVTVIDAKAARRLRLKTRGSVTGTGAAGEATAARLDAASISFGGAVVDNLTLYALPLESFAASFGRPVGGVVGNDVIGRFVVEIDYAKRVVNFHDPASYHYRGAGSVVPVTIEDDGLPFARGEVEIEGRAPLACKFEIDTGSTGAVLFNTPFVREHDLLSSVSRSKGINIGGVGGTGSAVLGRVGAVRLGGFTLREPVARFSQATKGDYASDKYDALMGGEVFRRFKLVVDLSRRRLIFEPNAALADPFEADMSGIELVADGARFSTYLIDDVDKGSPADEAGVRGGDILTAIDSRPARSLTLEEIRAMFRRDGQEYLLTLRRGGRIVRARVKLRRMV